MEKHRNFVLKITRMTISVMLFVFSTTSLAQIEPKELSEQSALRLSRVPEFAFIQEEANKLGIKVYLFGGTASAFAHYVRWDLEREAGDTKYQVERFDYDFTNIYRGNQDLDIVVDGTVEQAEILKEILEEKYPHFAGDKDAWEVRLLKAQISDKLPLLNNYDFLNQHTDTNSTGMLAINPDEDDIVFRDLFAWEDSESQFLKDVANGEIKFLFSETHHKTKRFKKGQNPPIFAAVRYLAKVTQYEVRGTERDLKIIKRIINETSWKKIKSNHYVKHKLEEFGKKVLLNAPNSEYAWNLLEDVGLRRKLIEMDGNRIKEEDSLSWWMNKEPLRSKEIGLGKNKTVAELFPDDLDENGELIVAHETNSFIAYENITRSSKGKANVFISRRSVSGEAAILGNGFYTRIGQEGGRGTNLTIRFKLHKDAREGSDFFYKNDYIVIKNKAALTLIQENLNISIIDYLKLFSSGEIKETDKGVIEKFNRKFNRVDPNSEEFQEAVQFVIDSFVVIKGLPLKYKIPARPSTLEDLFYMYFEGRYDFLKKNIKEIGLNSPKKWQKNPDWVKQLVDLNVSEIDLYLIEYILPDSYWSQYPEIVFKMLKRDVHSISIFENILSKKKWIKNQKLINKFIDSFDSVHSLNHFVANNMSMFKTPETLLKIIKRLRKLGTFMHYSEAAKAIFNHPKWSNDYFFIKTLIQQKIWNKYLIYYVLFRPKWAKHSDLIELLIKRKDESINDDLIEYVLSEPHWVNRDDLVEKILYSTGNHDKIINKILAHIVNGKVRVNLIEKVLDSIDNNELENPYMLRLDFARYVFTEPGMAAHPQLLRRFLRIKDTDDDVARFVFKEPEWEKHHQILAEIIDRGNANSGVTITLASSRWIKYPYLVEKFIRVNKGENRVLLELIKNTLSSQHWVKHPYLVEELIQRKNSFLNEEIAYHILSHPVWEGHPEFVKQLIASETLSKFHTRLLLNRDHWKSHPALQEEVEEYRPLLSKAFDSLIAPIKKARDLLKHKPLTCNSILE